MSSLFNDKPVYYNNIQTKGLDSLIESSDKLGMHDYAKALATFIRECDTPMTVGIQGDWGIGKTSLLNMIHAYLKGTHGSEYGLIWFNTWHYSLFGQDEYLGIAAINGILQQIKKEFNIDDKVDWMKNTTSIINNVLKSAKFSAFGFSIDAGSAIDQSEGSGLKYDDISAVMLSFKSDFEKLVKHILNTVSVKGKKIDRIVFFIDDLDRVKPIKALELLESIKNFMDVEGCVFVLAVDYEVVQMGMAEKFGIDLQKSSGKSFFDKIIQLPFTMPSTNYNLGNYLKGLLENIGISKVPDDEINFYEEITSITVGRNPRSIKRIINYVQLIRIIRGKHATKETKDSFHQRKILYALLCMQVAWPEIFNYFVKSPTPATIKNIENWDYLDQLPFIDKLYSRTPNVDQLKSNISAFFDLFYELIDQEEPFGIITRKEMEPVWNVLRIARLTVEKDFRQPFDVFYDMSIANDRSKIFYSFADIFKRSKWVSSNSIDYKLSGKRYVTLVHKRKQIGSLVSLKSNPFIFRLDFEDEQLKKYILDQFQKQNRDINLDFIKPVEFESLTGFGQTQIDAEKLSKYPKEVVTEILNILFHFTVTHTK